MKIYVVETIYDYSVACGVSLSEKIARSVANKLKKDNPAYDYWVTEYDVNEYNFTDFE